MPVHHYWVVFHNCVSLTKTCFFFEYKRRLTYDSIYTNVAILKTFFAGNFTAYFLYLKVYRIVNIGYITVVQTDMDFMFAWQERYLTSERSDDRRRSVICSCCENIKFISPRHGEMFCLLFGFI